LYANSEEKKSQNKQRRDDEDQHDCDVLPHVYEIGKILFVGFLELTHAAKIRILGMSPLVVSKLR
jgi:hypothetical protein